MKFFQISEGRLHAGRIAGLLYVVALVPGCREVLVVEPLCLMRIIFTAGWWLSFGEKQPARSLSEMLHPLGIIGIALILWSASLANSISSGTSELQRPAHCRIQQTAHVSEWVINRPIAAESSESTSD
jgi:hypothetical protein